MPRLSLWRDGRHTNDYRFIDRRVSEFMNISGTGVFIHKYLGPVNQDLENNPEQPNYINQSERNIQDLLLLENRDRRYEENVYPIRGHYQVTDNSFDLSQFGLFLQTGTLFMTFHYNDMVDILGRKIMNGDVFELEHLKDYHALDEDVPVALKRFFVATDCTKASEGYSATWWPHLWRVKMNPLVDSQEYRDILARLTVSEDSTDPLRSILSNYDKYTEINDAVVEKSEQDLPASGYDTTPFFHRSGDEDSPRYAISGYLASSVDAPNGANVVHSITFPTNANVGDYCLRTDFVPNRLFRYDGRRWVKMEDKSRTNITNAASDNLTQRNSFINNTRVYKDVNGKDTPERQNLNEILKPRAD